RGPWICLQQAKNLYFSPSPQRCSGSAEQGANLAARGYFFIAARPPARPNNPVHTHRASTTSGGHRRRQADGHMTQSAKVNWNPRVAVAKRNQARPTQAPQDPHHEL